jgi:hypothetical protein
MKKENEYWRFIRRGALFLALLLACVLIVNSLYFALIFTQKQIYRKEALFQEYLAAHPEKHLTACVFGDSHADNGLDLAAIPGAYAFTLIGEKYPTTYFKLKKLYAEGMTIDAVVLEVDPHSLTSWLKDEAVTRSQLYFYAEDRDYPDLTAITGDSYLKYLLLSRLHFIGQGDDLTYLVQQPSLADIRLGATRKEGDFSQFARKEEDAQTTFDLLLKGKDLYGEQTIEYFLKTVALAQEHGSKVVLVTYPQTPEFRRIAAEHNITVPTFRKEVMRRLLGKECRDYRWLDESEFFLNDSDPERFFSDAHHLNPEGARRLSAALVQALE